jgi:aspartyl-tRNA synthetase
MDRTDISNLSLNAGNRVRVAGFVSKIRLLKNVQFVIIQDRTGMVQVTNERTSPANQLEELIGDLTVGSTVEAIGKVILNNQVKLGQLEIIADEVIVRSRAHPELPIAEDSGLESQLNWRFLGLRKPANLLIFEIQTTVEGAMRRFWYEHGFIEVHSPKLMHSASESGADTFSLNYFELGKAYLAQSPQFYKQMAMAAGFERIFEIGPVFRAEPSFTPRHATEFTSVDVEISWVDSHEDVMSFEERWLRFVLQAVREKHGDAIEKTFGVEVMAPDVPFPRVPMAEAHRILKDLGHIVPATTKAGDIDPEGERSLARFIRQEYGNEFFFLTDYPVGLRPFYHMRNEAIPSITNSFDLMWKGTEITTGAQREHRYEALVKQAEEAGLRDSVEYYLDFFKYGCPPHGGFGLGLARVIMVLLNAPSIREVTFLHRGPQRLTP